MKRARAALILAACFAPPLHAAQGDAAGAYPSKPIRIVVAFAPGGNIDITARTIAPGLSEILGQPVLVDNRGGAGGRIGATLVAKAPPDGYTVLLSSPTIALSPLLYSNLSYDVARDFAPVARLASIENVVLVHPTVPAKTLKEFIALARSRPGKLN
jgi:tripartite-type tricarboxylate transporter receptor subunit TctC